MLNTAKRLNDLRALCLNSIDNNSNANGNNNINNNGRSRGMTLTNKPDNNAMKRHNNLYQKICSYENIELAFRKARKHKHPQTTKKLLEPIEQKFIGELSTKEINKWLKTAKAQ